MTDRNVFRAVVLFLGGTLALTVLGIAVLAGLDKAIPGILENVAVGCLTGLAGLLARGPSDEPQDVRVVQPHGQPVPVEDTGAGELRFIALIGCGIVAGVVLLYLLREVVHAVALG